MRVQRGFTLIELVVVIIILGIMAAIAVPKFVDITTEAHTAAARGVAGALSSGSSINYATRAAGGTGKGTPIASQTSCTPAVAQPLLSSATAPKLVSVAPINDDEFQISMTTGGNNDCSAGAATATCDITPKGSVTAAKVTLLCIS